MSVNYARMQASALAALNRAGVTVTRRAFTSGGYDPATGTDDVTTTDTTRTGCLFDYQMKGEMFVNGRAVIEGDKQLIIDGTGGCAASDHYLILGQVYTVVGITQIPPMGTPVIYDVHVRLA